MSKLTSQQKEFLKGIPNKKARQEQKIQFKLQNEFEIAKISWVKMGEEGIEYIWHEHDIEKSFKTKMDSINKEENLCKDKSWYETQLEDKFIPKENINGFLYKGKFYVNKDNTIDYKGWFNGEYKEKESIENSITKEVLKNVIEPNLSELVSKRLKEQL